jgi:hypothetical protein
LHGVTVDDCAKFIGQPTQYGVGRGSRLSILVVLDHSKEGSALGVFDALDREVFDEDVGRFEDQPPAAVGPAAQSRSGSSPALPAESPPTAILVESAVNAVARSLTRAYASMPSSCASGNRLTAQRAPLAKTGRDCQPATSPINQPPP